MNEDKNSTITIYAPRSLAVSFLQTISVAPLTVAMILLVIFLFLLFYATNVSILGMLILLSFIVLSLASAFVMFKLPSQYVARLTFDRQTRFLTKTKKGDEPIIFDLTGAQQIVAKRVYTNPGWTYTMVVQDRKGVSQVIFDENPPYGGTHWMALSERLSEVTGLPLKQEQWVEDGNGNLAMVKKAKTPWGKLSHLVLAAAPIAVTLAGVALFKIRPTQTAFFVVGIATVLVNLTIAFTYKLLNRRRMDDSNTYFLLTVSTLMLIIPYAMLFLFSVFIANDFRLPFGH